MTVATEFESDGLVWVEVGELGTTSTATGGWGVGGKVVATGVRVLFVLLDFCKLTNPIAPSKAIKATPPTIINKTGRLLFMPAFGRGLMGPSGFFAFVASTLGSLEEGGTSLGLDGLLGACLLRGCSDFGFIFEEGRMRVVC